MTRMEVTRRVAADPASVALLLAGPAARTMWPATADVRVGPPLRSGVGFVADMTVVGEGTASVRGRFTILPAVESPGASDVRLVLMSPTGARATLRSCGASYLDNLAEAAASRSSAA